MNYSIQRFRRYSLLKTLTEADANAYNIVTAITTYTFVQVSLTLKALITTAADDSCFFFYFSEETSLDISCESSAWQMIHMKCRDLFSLKNNKKNFECCLLQILLGALRVKIVKWQSNRFFIFVYRIFLLKEQFDLHQHCLLRHVFPNV